MTTGDRTGRLRLTRRGERVVAALGVTAWILLLGFLPALIGSR